MTQSRATQVCLVDTFTMWITSLLFTSSKPAEAVHKSHEHQVFHFAESNTRNRVII